MTTQSSLPAFERSAELYDYFYSEDGKDYDREAAVYLHHFGRDCVDVMDIGAGTGEFSSRWRAEGLKVWAVEPSRAMADRFEAKWGYAPTVLGWEDIPTREKVDAVAATFGTFSYAAANPPAHGRSAGLLCLVEAREVLRQGGRLVMDVLNYGGCLENLGRFEITRQARGWRRHLRKTFDAHTSIQTTRAEFWPAPNNPAFMPGDPIKAEFSEVHKMRAFTPSELESLCLQAGFRSVKCFPYDDQHETTKILGPELYFMVVAVK